MGACPSCGGTLAPAASVSTASSAPLNQWPWHCTNLWCRAVVYLPLSSLATASR